MAHTSDTHRNTYDEPLSLARPMIVGSIAGVLACVGFFNLQGYGRYSTDLWNGGMQGAPSRQYETNAVAAAGSSGTHAAQPDGSNQGTGQGGEQQEQGYAPAEPQQGYGPPQQNYDPSDQGQGYGHQQGDAPSGPLPPNGVVNQPSPQEPYR